MICNVLQVFFFFKINRYYSIRSDWLLCWSHNHTQLLSLLPQCQAVNLQMSWGVEIFLSIKGQFQFTLLVLWRYQTFCVGNNVTVGKINAYASRDVFVPSMLIKALSCFSKLIYRDLNWILRLLLETVDSIYSCRITLRTCLYYI